MNMDLSNLIKSLVLFTVMLLLYIYIQMVIEWRNTDTGTKYVVHAEGEKYYCENVQKTSLDLIGYHCNNKYPVVEFRSPHVVIHRGE